MNILTISLSFLFSVGIAAAPAVKTKTNAESRRIIKTINSGWTFNYFPEKSDITSIESPSFDDSKWQSVCVPHTWSTYETTGELHPYIRNAAESDDPYWWTGWGWYRKHFSINEKYSDRKVYVEFEGVMKYCKVWINGHYLGDHKGGYGSFDFDLTPYIIKSGDNILVVAVNNLRKDPLSIPPMAAGNFNVYGGIYRDVTLVLKDPLYIPMQGSAVHEGGTFITTPGVSEQGSVVRVQTWVKNDYPSGKNCVLRTTITDATGKIIQTVTSKATIKPGELFRFDQMSKQVIKPRLWSPEDPYIYKVYSEVTDGKIVLDSYQSPLGFRWFRWDYKENFLYVNGKKTILQGGNRHQEYPWLGDAIPKWITEMDFYDMAVNLKYNFMRTAHYPNDKMVYDLTDKYGIIIDEESPSIKNQVFSVEVQEQQMKEMIRRDRNHPSIMLWGMGNETNHAVDSKFAFVEDTTRILTARRVSDGSAGKYVTHTDENLALENLLRCTIRGWYNSDVKNLSPTDAQHCGTEEHQQNMLLKSGRFGTGNLCVWLYEDHGADREYLNAPLLHVNPKGYVDSYRIPKYAYYFWQANYYDKPMVFILPHFWRSQYLGQKKDINIDSNCDTVELFVNGISQGVQYPDNKNFHNVTFRNIPVQQGTLSATGKLNGKNVSASVTMAGEPSKIVVSASHKQISSNLSSVVIIKADITDKDGNHVYGATNMVRWSVQGPATLVGPQVYESNIKKHHDMEGTMYIDMPVANVIRSAGKPGTIIVNVSSPGLAIGSCEIIAEEAVSDNTLITEPIPDERGRMKVAKKPVTVPVKEITKELKDNPDEILLQPTGREGYSEFITGFILKANKGIDSSTMEFKALTGLFVNHLMNNNGKLIADDYNFFAGHYNICRELAGTVNNTWLPAPFKTSVRKYFADKIITAGMNINLQEEEERIKAIPAEGNIVYVQAKDALSAGKSGVLTTETDLAAIVALVHPEISDWEPELRAKVIGYVAGINPYIQTTLKGEVVDNKKITKSFYKVGKGEPIWVPAISYLNAQNPTTDGYKGIWFTLGQFTEYGDKYSGGLGTYTADHIPIAIYSPKAKKTFFVYGGTTKADERHLLIMISYFDHVKKVVPKPVIVYDKEGVNDPHDDAALSIDENGYIWVFVSGRAKARPGIIFKSRQPYSIDSFDKILQGEMTYPQPWWVKGQGFLYLLTKYTNGRELYWSTSKDGKTWAPDKKLAGMGGHYQISNMYGKKLVSVFNYHPGGNVDKRTNIYAVQTEDLGKTWKTIDGKIFTPPLSDHHNPSLIYDYEAEHKLVYINDLGFDNAGDPVILAIVSRDYRPGPGGDPREWMVIRWKNGKWNFRKVCESTHNYDMGSLYIEKGIWRIFGPTEPGPQKWGAGGEMAIWESRDDGESWKRIKLVTQYSTRNNSYARRPLDANDDFYAIWADGDPDRLSESHLYFSNREGDVVKELPYNMEKEFQAPAIVSMKERNMINIPVVAQSAIKSPVYSVKVNGQEVFVEKYKSYNYCSLEATSAFSVEVMSKNAISVISISPQNLDIKQVAASNSSKFTLPGPGYYAMKINNSDRLFIFADLPDDQSVKNGILITGMGIDNTGKTIETDKIQKAINSSAASGRTLVFPAGIYSTGSLSVPSGARIYLSAGSVIKAADDLSLLSFNDTIKPRSFIRIKDAKNVSIRGRGVIDANGRVLRDKYGDEARMRLMLILNSSDVNIDGIIVRDPGSWNTHILYSEKIDIRNVKMLNDIDLSNTDGFDPDASKNVVIDHCFAYCSDDNVAVKSTGTSGYLRDAENIIVRNCVFLTKKSALKVGTESLSATMKNIAFVNNDVIESDRGMALYCADGATFDDIRFISNRFESNWPDAKRCGINFTITKRNQGSRAGEMKNILIKDCSFATEFPRVSEILGFDKDHRINLTIENLKIGGKKCTGLLDCSIKTNEFSDLNFK